MNGHRPSMARSRIAERVRISVGPLTKETNLVRCTVCNEPITMRPGRDRNSWRHGMPEGDIEVIA